jgi:hypothetical protein
MKKKPYSKITGGLIAAWFVLALAASALNVFETDPNRPPLPLLVSVLVPLMIFSIWYLSSRGFREFVLSLNPSTLTMVQAWRIAGFVFLVLYAYRMLPGLFALPAGWGDVAIGATALVVAVKFASPAHRTSFILWQLLGVADLVIALGTGAAGRFIRPQDFTGASGITTSPMTVLPLSLIPTFGVPLFLILHIICIAQARRWPKRELKPAQDGLHPLAVHS